MLRGLETKLYLLLNPIQCGRFFAYSVRKGSDITPPPAKSTILFKTSISLYQNASMFNSQRLKKVSRRLHIGFCHSKGFELPLPLLRNESSGRGSDLTQNLFEQKMCKKWHFRVSNGTSVWKLNLEWFRPKKVLCGTKTAELRWGGSYLTPGLNALRHPKSRPRGSPSKSFGF